MVNFFFCIKSYSIFIITGEWDITPYRLTNSLMAQLASELNGNIFYLEHRFYGQSRPTP